MNAETMAMDRTALEEVFYMHLPNRKQNGEMNRQANLTTIIKWKRFACH